jgi:RecG-like helicase
MTEYGISDYYATRLSKVGFDFYKFLTYLPFRLEVISPDLHKPADLYFITGKIIRNLDKGKYMVYTVKTVNGEIGVFDFAKKLRYMKDFDDNQEYQILITNSKDYISLVDIVRKSYQTSSSFELGKLENKVYYRPIYSLINFQIRSKQINNIHKDIKSDFYKLNLKGLVPPNSIVPEIMDMEMIHKPTSLEEYRAGIKNWNNFNAFLNIVFLNHLDDIKPNHDTVLNPYPKNFVDDFQKSIDIKLSPSQLKAIDEILTHITFKNN